MAPEGQLEQLPYLMEASDALARFRVVRHGDLVMLNDGAGTMSFSAEDAKALSRGLLVVASGAATLATTETALRLLAEDRERRLRIQAQNRSQPLGGATQTQSPTRIPAPKLEDL